MQQRSPTKGRLSCPALLIKSCFMFFSQFSVFPVLFWCHLFQVLFPALMCSLCLWLFSLCRTCLIVFPLLVYLLCVLLSLCASLSSFLCSILSLPLPRPHLSLAPALSPVKTLILWNLILSQVVNLSPVSVVSVSKMAWAPESYDISHTIECRMRERMLWMLLWG